MIKVIPLFSGSSGNACYIRCDDTELLVDAGVSAKRLGEALAAIGTSLSHVAACLVTHEHADHVKGLEMLAKHYGFPVYINESSYNAMAASQPTDALSRVAVFKEAGESIDVGSIRADIFRTPHDAFGSVGYRFSFPDGSSLGYATDIGYVTKGIAAALFGCETVILESNHDVQMLMDGPYPYHLKQRILSEKGHLSNAACASFLPHLYQSGTKKVILAHLSEHNNTPLLAYNESVSALDKAGISQNDCKVTVAMKSILDA